jgi:two-component system response regulator WspF
VAVVNDSVIAVAALRHAVESVPGWTVAWVAVDGEEAVRRCAEDRPDVVLMDLYMPRMDGVEATRQIMRATPCPILVVTSRVDGAIDKVYDAMSAGALDAVDTPTGGDGAMAGAASMIAKIKTIARLPRGRRAAAGSSRAVVDDVSGASLLLVALGASTGGPAALAEVLTHLRDLPAAVVIVQHVDKHYALGLASWLSEHSGLPVETVAVGAQPRAGHALLAATGDHLIMTSVGALGYTPRPLATPYRPSVDVFFRSLVSHWPRPCAAALLTGMGKDGADGLLQLRRAGWWTIAQDEASSVVWGMPRAAVELAAARAVLPLAGIGPALREQVVAAASRRPIDSRRR